jgi:hypothetical protein
MFSLYTIEFPDGGMDFFAFQGRNSPINYKVTFATQPQDFALMCLTVEAKLALYLCYASELGIRFNSLLLLICMLV